MLLERSINYHQSVFGVFQKFKHNGESDSTGPTFKVLNENTHLLSTLWHEIFVGVYFCGLAIFCVLWELIFVIKTDWFFCWELILPIFRKYPVPSIDILIFIANWVCAIQYKHIFSNNKPFFHSIMFCF